MRLPVPEGDYETLAGFVLDRLGHIPEVGEGFDHDGWEVEVAALDGLRVATVVLRRPDGAADMIASLLFGLVLLVANGFFVAVEFALLASRRTDLEAMADQGSARARLALGSMRHLNLQLAGAQLGITMASLLLGYVAEPAVSGLIEDAVEPSSTCPRACCTPSGSSSPSPSWRSSTWSSARWCPKNIAIAAPERTLLALALPNRVYVTVFGPLLRFLNGLANAGVRLLGVEPRDELATAASRRSCGRCSATRATRGSSRTSPTSCSPARCTCGTATPRA